jgi:hypothetical protein
MRSHYGIIRSLQEGSNESLTRNLYHATMTGAVAKCHNECASMTLHQGGKSNISKQTAHIIDTPIIAG